jgi:hypothetical protein
LAHEYLLDRYFDANADGQPGGAKHPGILIEITHQRTTAVNLRFTIYDLGNSE